MVLVHSHEEKQAALSPSNSPGHKIMLEASAQMTVADLPESLLCHPYNPFRIPGHSYGLSK